MIKKNYSKKEKRVHLLVQSELTVSGLRYSTGNCLSIVSIPSASWLPREFLPWNGCPPSSKPWQTFSSHFCEQAHTLSSLVPLQSPVMIQPCSWQIHEADFSAVAITAFGIWTASEGLQILLQLFNKIIQQLQISNIYFERRAFQSFGYISMDLKISFQLLSMLMLLVQYLKCSRITIELTKCLINYTLLQLHITLTPTLEPVQADLPGYVDKLTRVANSQSNWSSSRWKPWISAGSTLSEYVCLGWETISELIGGREVNYDAPDVLEIWSVVSMLFNVWWTEAASRAEYRLLDAITDGGKPGATGHGYVVCILWWVVWFWTEQFEAK